MQTTLAQFNESESEDRFSLQNPRMLRLVLDGDAVNVRAGSLVAVQGELELDDAPTPARTPLRTLSGRGRAFLAEHAQNIHLVELEGESVTCDAERVLAVDAGVQCAVLELSGDRGAGVHGVTMRGGGWVALLSHGAPVLLDVTAGPTVVRAGAAIVWAEDVEAEPADPGLVRFGGRGWVLVQASPTAPEPAPEP